MKLFIPGPVQVSAEILSEMSREMIYHRSQEFRALLAEVKHYTAELLSTENEILVVTGSATGAMEAAARSLVRKKATCLANGEFGRRWNEIAKANGKETELLDFGDGNEIVAGQVAAALQKKPDAICMVLNDTSTGIENDIETIKKLIHNESPETLLIVDAVTAAFGTPIRMQGIDLMLFGTQKCLALPPGMSIVIASQKAMETTGSVKDRGYYLDLARIKQENDRNQTLTTPPVQLLYALRKRLHAIREKGIEPYIRKHAEQQKLVRKWFCEKGFEMTIPERLASKTVTVIRNTRSIDVQKTISTLAARGYLIADGYGKLKGETFRIGHMGDITLQDTTEMLAEFEETTMTTPISS